jgi:hypothetical protein
MSRSKGSHCRCRRKRKGKPKVASGFCHGAGYSYHPTVYQRIEGRQCCRAWEKWGGDANDFNDSVFEKKHW